jgi:hypothetical protein
MTVRELIVALTKVDPESRAEVYFPDGEGSAPITGVDPYEESSVLVVDWETP